jgi:surface polysaccharide O-acyltransferase-like enzyme
MVQWLKDDVYLAAGLSPVVTLIGILVYSPKKETGNQDWARIVLYVVATPTFLAASVTPGLKQDIKYFVRYWFFFCNACIIVDRKPR